MLPLKLVFSQQRLRVENRDLKCKAEYELLNTKLIVSFLNYLSWESYLDVNTDLKKGSE